MYIFLETYKTNQSNIGAKMKTMSCDDFYEKLCEGGISYKQFRYAKLGEETSIVKDMTLPEFEEAFADYDKSKFDFYTIDRLFRKEVSKKYGSLQAEKDLEYLGAKDLKPFHVYRQHNPYEKPKGLNDPDYIDQTYYVYLGKVKDRVRYGESGNWHEGEGKLLITLSRYKERIENVNDVDGLYRISHFNIKPTNIKSYKLIECVGRLDEFIGNVKFDRILEYKHSEKALKDLPTISHKNDLYQIEFLEYDKFNI